MFKRSVLMLAIAAGICIGVAEPLMAQSKEEGIRLYNEANALKKQVRSPDDWKKAFSKYEKALKIFEKVNAEMWQGVTLNQMGLVCYEAPLVLHCKGFGGLGYYEKALALHRKTKNTRWELVTLQNIGHTYLRHRKLKQAVRSYEEALVLARKLHDAKQEGRTLRFLAELYADSFLNEPRKALEIFQKSLAIERKARDREGEMDTLDRIGQLYRRFGQYQKALQTYEACLTISKNTNDLKREGRILALMAEAHGILGLRRKAFDCCERSLDAANRSGDQSRKGDILFEIAKVYENLEEYEKALELYRKATETKKRIGRGAGSEEGRIAGVYLALGDVAKAESVYKKSGFYPFPDGHRLFLLKSEFEKVLRGKDIWISMSKRRGDVQYLFLNYTHQGLAHEGLDQLNDASEEFRQAVYVTEQIRDSLTEGERANFLDARVAYLPRITPYEGLCRVLVKLGKPVEALKVAEATKARAFCESLSRRSEGALLGVPQNVLDEGTRIDNKLSALLKALGTAYEKGKKDSADDVESLENQVKEARTQRDAHIAKLRKDYPLFAATKYPQPTELQDSALRDDEWVLEYQVTEPGVAIFLTKGKNLVRGLFRPVSRKEIDELIRRFRQPMELAPDDTVSKKLSFFDFASGKKLADILLADVLSHLPKGAPLIIIPDGPLGVVPFEMLVLNDGGKVVTDKSIPYASGAEFFGDRNPISYYQSITALTLARTLGRQHKPKDRTLAMVDPVFSADDARLLKAAVKKRRAALDRLTGEKLMSFRTELKLEVPRLPLTGKLGESLKKANPAGTDLFEGMKAQKSELLRKDLTPYRSVAFATHGYFGKDLPGIQEPVLILTLVDQPKDQDGFLRLTEVMGLKLNCDVAALTACQTGLGRHVSGEGTMGMGRAFQYAGAKSVLMSLWSVAESSSVDLVTSFFKHLREGKNKLEALKLAREEIRKAGYDHPFFWAPFILVGEVD